MHLESTLFSNWWYTPCQMQKGVTHICSAIRKNNVIRLVIKRFSVESPASIHPLCTYIVLCIVQLIFQLYKHFHLEIAIFTTQKHFQIVYMSTQSDIIDACCYGYYCRKDNIIINLGSQWSKLNAYIKNKIRKYRSWQMTKH